jgi:large subunit ribosomal protein L21
VAAAHQQETQEISMYAVLSSGGKQYRVEAGNELILERVPGDAGASITFDRVLLVGDGDAVTVGTPTVAGASVSGTVLGEALGPKLIVFKFKQKATYRRKNGHRQHLTRVRIDEILTDGKGTKAKAKAETADEAAPPTATRAAKAEKAEKAEPAAKAATAEKKPAARTRKPAAKAATKADATDEAKPKRTRKPAAKKAEAEE